MVKVWVNGTFDVLHIGHIKLLEFASRHGLVRVGVDCDERVRLRKGQKRPFNILPDRIEFLNSIKFVDSVVSFSSDEELIFEIQKYETNIIVVGDDYIDKEIIGRNHSTKILYFTKIKNKSTSKILSYGETQNM
jgi:D-beta-D-heptose 7-phosphate kinase/D-beta-D-heptose 1-phosphate adenosyltransferase